MNDERRINVLGTVKNAMLVSSMVMIGVMVSSGVNVMNGHLQAVLIVVCFWSMFFVDMCVYVGTRSIKFSSTQKLDLVRQEIYQSLKKNLAVFGVGFVDAGIILVITCISMWSELRPLVQNISSISLSSIKSAIEIAEVDYILMIYMLLLLYGLSNAVVFLVRVIQYVKYCIRIRNCDYYDLALLVADSRLCDAGRYLRIEASRIKSSGSKA